MLVTTLLERGLGSGPIHGRLLSENQEYTLRVWSTAIATMSVLADLVAIHWFVRMKKKWRHSLVILLLGTDLLKSINFITMNVSRFSTGSLVTHSAVCQATGFFRSFLTEMSDFTILAIVVHMSMQVLSPDLDGDTEGGLARWKISILASILGVPLIMACIPFSNPNGGYQVVGLFCFLPLRPFWYQLFLNWIPRYLIATAIIVLTIIVRLRVRQYQQKLALLQMHMANPGVMEAGIIEEVDEQEASENDSAAPLEKDQAMVVVAEPQINEKRLTKISMLTIQADIPPMPADHQQFDAEDLRKYKHMSYKRPHSVQHNAASALAEFSRQGSMGAPSVAPSSAIFASPARGNLDKKRQSLMMLPQTPSPTRRRQSVAGGDIMRRAHSVADFGTRRASVMEITTRTDSMSRNSMIGGPNMNLDRMSSIHSTGRRSSIWDEIDASLEKKVSNRVSIFTVNALDGAEIENITYVSDNPLASSRPTSMLPANDQAGSRLSQNLSRSEAVRDSCKSSLRKSRVYEIARRSMSVMSHRRTSQQDEAPDSPAAILRRRHNYIERQLRYLMVYPLLYVLLWLWPFVLHVLQYQDRFASHPPFYVVVLAVISFNIFGAVNSVVFCLREKPWTAIPDSDGSVRGSFATFPPWVFVRDLWCKVTGRRSDDAMDFEG